MVVFVCLLYTTLTSSDTQPHSTSICDFNYDFDGILWHLSLTQSQNHIVLGRNLHYLMELHLSLSPNSMNFSAKNQCQNKHNWHLRFKHTHLHTRHFIDLPKARTKHFATRLFSLFMIPFVVCQFKNQRLFKWTLRLKIRWQKQKHRMDTNNFDVIKHWIDTN